MTIQDGFNISGILIGIAFVIYFGYIGRALKAKLEWIKIPAIVTGFVSTMFVWSILFMGVHQNPVNDYKIWFIIYIIATMAIATIAKPWVKFKFNKWLIGSVVLAVAGSIVTAATFPNVFGGMNNDHWLYMKWLSEASEFVSSGIGEQRGITYGLSAFYRFIGSFIGMLGQTLEYLGKENYDEIRQYSPIYQTSTMILIASLTVELIKHFINNKKYVLMLPIFIVTFWFVETYRSTTIGSILLWIPVAYIYAMIYRKEYDQKTLVLVTVPFALFSSSVFMIFIGAVVMNIYFIKDSKPWSTLVFGTVLFTKYVVALVALDEQLNYFLVIVAIFALVYLFTDFLKKVINAIVRFISKRPLWTQWILFILITVWNIIDMHEGATDVEMTVLRRMILLKFVMVALYMEWRRGNKDLFIAVCLMSILNLPYMELLNIASGYKLNSVMHRFGQLLLMGDRHSIIHWAYLIPVFLWIVIKNWVSKGGSDDVK